MANSHLRLLSTAPLLLSGAASLLFAQGSAQSGGANAAVAPAGGAQAAAVSRGGRPTHLEADELTEPLGIDAPHPELSWRLNDARPGARQTAYQIAVYSKRPGAAGAKPDVWDSGRVSSATSTGVAYAGPELQPSTRYFWRVTAFDAAGKAYPASEVSWFETGLVQQANWHAEWIGQEPAELHSLRGSGAVWITNAAAGAGTSAHTVVTAFRLHTDFAKPIASAALYTTGADTAAAWVNGQQVLDTEPLPPWQEMPWATYRRADVTAALRTGENVLAIGVTRYKTARGASVPMQSPMSGVLYVRYADGTTELRTTADAGWKTEDVSEKAKGRATADWWQPAVADGKWAAAQPYRPGSDPFGSAETGEPWPTGPVAALRKTFSTAGHTVVSARLYATALGAYKFRLNGQAVGDQILSPGWMDFREHVPYQVYDVTAQVHAGENAIAAYLAPGWYATPLRALRQGNNYGNTQPALKAQLRLQYADGSVAWVATDSTWTAHASRITFAEIYDGETDDARLEQPGWDTAAFHPAGTAGADDAWQPATVVPAKEPELLAQYFQPIRTERTLSAVKITEPRPGTWVLDFGQNMSAIPHLRVRGAAGSEINLRFAEVLNPDGTLYVDNLRTAKATDHFILRGTGAVEDFQPLFTFHGFRYAEITGMGTRPTAQTLVANVLHTDAPFTTTFATGDTMVNSLWKIVQWGQRSNFVGLPTDCPQRDERLGWSADAQVFWRTATYNMDLSTFSRKFSADLHGTQVGTAMYGIYAPGLNSPNPGYGAAWSDAGVIIPWTGWLQSGDARIIEQNWTGMEAYLAEILANNPNHLWQKHFGAAFGDWLTPTITTPEDLLATAYWAYDVSLMHEMAAATNRTEEATRYAQLFEQIRAAFEQAYTHANGTVSTIDHFPSIPPPTIHPTADDQIGKPVETQTGYVLALYMHLIPDNLRSAAADRLVAMVAANGERLGTGFVGTPYLLEVLANTGHADVAYKLLLNRAYPSWGYLIDHGATTTWERWNGDTMRADPSMNSYNHYAYGAVAEWLYRFAAGVDADPADPGFRTTLLHPTFDPRLGHLEFTYSSRLGPVHSAWRFPQRTGGKLTWTVTLPPNSTGVLATSRINATLLTLNGKPMDRANLKAGTAPGDLLLPSGTYTFTATMNPTLPTSPSTETADVRH